MNPKEDTLKKELQSLNLQVSQHLWDIWQGKDTSKLIFPFLRTEGNQNPKERRRVSEQESRVIFCRLLENSRWRYAVEAPTEKRYQQKGLGTRSGNTDLCLYELPSPGSRTVNIELKSNNPPMESFRKDIEQLVREGINGVWFHTLKSQNRATLPSVCKKIKHSFENLENYLAEGDPRFILFAFCMLDEPDNLIEVEVSLGSSSQRTLAELNFSIQKAIAAY